MSLAGWSVQYRSATGTDRDRLDDPDRLHRGRRLLPGRGGGGSGRHHRPADPRRGGRHDRHRRRQAATWLPTPQRGSTPATATSRTPRSSTSSAAPHGHVLRDRAVAANATTPPRLPLPGHRGHQQQHHRLPRRLALAEGAGATGGTFTGTIAGDPGQRGERDQARLHRHDHGVVTAAYTTGGFNGFYMQTAGSGGASDPTHNASDAIFVFVGPRASARSRPSATPPTWSAWSRSSTA